MHTWAHTHIRTRAHAFILLAGTYKHTCMQSHACMYLHTHACMHMLTHTCTHTLKQTKNNPVFQSSNCQWLCWQTCAWSGELCRSCPPTSTRISLTTGNAAWTPTNSTTSKCHRSCEADILPEQVDATSLARQTNILPEQVGTTSLAK